MVGGGREEKKGREKDDEAYLPETVHVRYVGRQAAALGKECGPYFRLPDRDIEAIPVLQNLASIITSLNLL